MSGFIKLTFLTINSSDICFIEKSFNKYIIYLKNDVLEGKSIFIAGGIQISKNIIEISESKNILDYKIIDEWIKNLK